MSTKTKLTPGQELAVEHGTILRDGVGWVPGAYVEDDAAACKLLTEEYGSERPSGYMSEETGWDISADEHVMAILAAERADLRALERARPTKNAQTSARRLKNRLTALS